MMMIGCLLAKGFDDNAYRIPREQLEAMGATVRVLAAREGVELVGRLRRERVRADQAIEHARPSEFSGLYIPGGRSPERLRRDPRIVAFVREIWRECKPIGALGHGPRLLLSAGIARGRRMTATFTVRGDLEAAGACVFDRDVVVDGSLVTSRASYDVGEIEAFSLAFLMTLGLGRIAQPEDFISVHPSS